MKSFSTYVPHKNMAEYITLTDSFSRNKMYSRNFEQLQLGSYNSLRSIKILHEKTAKRGNNTLFMEFS